MSCPNCTMYVPDHPLVWESGFAAYAVEGPVWHECPEPLPYEVALMWKHAANAAGGIVVSPRLRAAVLMGLERGPHA